VDFHFLSVSVYDNVPQSLRVSQVFISVVFHFIFSDGVHTSVLSSFHSYITIFQNNNWLFFIFTVTHHTIFGTLSSGYLRVISGALLLSTSFTFIFVVRVSGCHHLIDREKVISISLLTGYGSSTLVENV
jgi:hypothetical protein